MIEIQAWTHITSDGLEPQPNHAKHIGDTSTNEQATSQEHIIIMVWRLSFSLHPGSRIPAPEKQIGSDYISGTTAVCTSANARIRLYQMLDWLHLCQICCCDADSAIRNYDGTDPAHESPEKHEATTLEFGGGLGQWEDEFGRQACIEE